MSTQAAPVARRPLLLSIYDIRHLRTADSSIHF
ncbi:hypothetical protein EDD27_4598 [Nonomuraea polychroma]|uniref:Uncharacterized protein n=1 Tax=Nonomuraea polychroma TaxID=46176 RepID=A0A438M8E3_9ACTN|nr:hypothetical protein EDD27_4598 [Nonomuraea polychroma]